MWNSWADAVRKFVQTENSWKSVFRKISFAELNNCPPSIYGCTWKDSRCLISASLCSNFYLFKNLLLYIFISFDLNWIRMIIFLYKISIATGVSLVGSTSNIVEADNDQHLNTKRQATGFPQDWQLFFKAIIYFESVILILANLNYIVSLLAMCCSKQERFL